MSDLNYRIDVNLLAAAPAVSAQQFDVILIISADAVFAADIVKTYYSPLEIEADSELTTQALKDFAKAVFLQSPNPGKVKIGEGGVGIDFGDDFLLCLAADPDFYGTIIHDRSQTEIEAVAPEVESNERLFIAQSSDAAVKAGTPANVLLNLAAAGYARTALIWHGTDTDALDLGWSAKKLSANPDTDVTTWSDSNVTGPAADTLTSTERDQITGDDGNVYLDFFSVAAAFPGKCVDGGWIDNVISGDWLRARVREGIAQLLLDTSQRNQKVPYTDAGIEQVASVVRQWLARGEAIGHFRPGSSVVNVPLLSSIPAATIQARDLTISAETTLSGAVGHTVTINIGVYEA